MKSRRSWGATIAIVVATFAASLLLWRPGAGPLSAPKRTPGKLNVDVLILIYSHSNSSDLRKASDERFGSFPLAHPDTTHVRLWADSSSGVQLTFTYFYTVGNDSLATSLNESALDLNSSSPPHLDVETRVLTMQIPSNYRALKLRTKAIMTARDHLLFPSWFPEPNFQLLLRLDDDTFPCLTNLFRKLLVEVRFAHTRESIGSSAVSNGRSAVSKKIDATLLWGGPWVNATVLTWWRHRWYDAEYLAEVGWKKGDPPVQYPGQYPAGFAMFAGRRFLKRLEGARDSLKVYGVDDAMVGVWVHKTLALKSGVDWQPFVVRSDNEMCHCSRQGWKPDKVGIDGIHVWHECKSYEEHARCFANLGPSCVTVGN
jgi:hypothetical protein